MWDGALSGIQIGLIVLGFIWALREVLTGTLIMTVGVLWKFGAFTFLAHLLAQYRGDWWIGMVFGFVATVAIGIWLLAVLVGRANNVSWKKALSEMWWW